MEGRMWPIRTEVKSKRLRHGKPQSFLTWAWQKELRENAQDRRIYREINPCTVRFSDPVRLHLLDLFRPVQLVKVI